MKALLPVYCRKVGYTTLGLSICLPFAAWYLDLLNDSNLLVYKAAIKILLIAGALLLFYARRRGENSSVEDCRSRAITYGVFITLFYLFVEMAYHIYHQDISYVDSSSFLTFLIISNVCLEYNIITKAHRNK